MVFFGGLHTTYVIYRFVYPEGYDIADAETNIRLRAANTALLLTFSATMAAAGWADAAGEKRHVMTGLVLTAALGLIF